MPGRSGGPRVRRRAPGRGSAAPTRRPSGGGCARARLLTDGRSNAPMRRSAGTWPLPPNHRCRGIHSAIAATALSMPEPYDGRTGLSRSDAARRAPVREARRTGAPSTARRRAQRVRAGGEVTILSHVGSAPLRRRGVERAGDRRVHRGPLQAAEAPARDHAVVRGGGPDHGARLRALRGRLRARRDLAGRHRPVRRRGRLHGAQRPVDRSAGRSRAKSPRTSTGAVRSSTRMPPQPTARRRPRPCAARRAWRCSRPRPSTAYPRTSPSASR